MSLAPALDAYQYFIEVGEATAMRSLWKLLHSESVLSNQKVDKLITS